MEGAAEGKDLGTAGLEGRQLEGVLIGLGAAVAKEQVELVIAADLTQFHGQGFLQAVLHGIRIESELADLLPDRLHVVRMAVADADDGVAAVQVQILLSRGVPQRGTLAFHRLDVPAFIYIE